MTHKDGISNTFSIVPKSLGPTDEERVDNLVTMMDGYFTKGAHHLNVNVLNREMLEDAMEHPENTRNHPRFGYAVNFAEVEPRASVGSHQPQFPRKECK